MKKFIIVLCTLSLTSCMGLNNPSLYSEPNMPPIETRTPLPENNSEQKVSTPTSVLGFASTKNFGETGKLMLHSNIETIGVVVTDNYLPEDAEIAYRKDGDNNWLPGHPLVRIGNDRLVGSLFGLSPATTYYIKLIFGNTNIIDSITTQPEEFIFTPEKIVHVDANASPGGDGSADLPFQTIQEGINNAGPGTKVLVADGIYHESVSMASSGTPENWMQVIAEGNSVILDGADHLTGAVWKPDPFEPNVWSTEIGQTTHYLARDGVRYYEYDDLASLTAGIGHDDLPMQEGWFVVANETSSTLFIRSLDDPAIHSWHIVRLSSAFQVDNLDLIWIEGFEIRYYDRGVILNNSSNVVIRHNQIHNVIVGIEDVWTGGEDRGNNNRIEFNEIFDKNVNQWPWQAVKGTSMEGTAIKVQSHMGTIVRGNHLYNFFDGIGLGKWGDDLENPNIAVDVDIYNNNIHDIGDDALEPEGASINQRFRNNMIDHSFVGISLAPIVFGPLWVMRNVFSNYNGTCIKWDFDYDGVVLIYHNDCWTNVEETNAVTVGGPVRNSVMRNNIFRGTHYSFEAPLTGSTNNDWDYNNWYTTRGADGPHFKWENIRYTDIIALCEVVAFECNGHDTDPGLADPLNKDFTLLPKSPNIDRGYIVPGINGDFFGVAPDIGAYEVTNLE